jgi:broad specificity phosphatase PhoE
MGFNRHGGSHSKHCPRKRPSRPGRVTTLLLARHAVTDWSLEGRWQGIADPPLNDLGREQAGTLAEQLDAVRLDAIYASSLRRAHETALAVGERKGLPVTPVPELREVDVGSWTGLAHSEIQERFSDAYRSQRARTGRGWEGGETYAEMGRRVLDALGRIAREHPDDTVLVVTHSGPIRTAHAHAVGLDYATDRKAAPRVAHAGYSVVTVADGVFRLTELRTC